MSKPHCYGKMIWILKYPEDETPKESICNCQYTNSCLRITRNNAEKEKAIGYQPTANPRNKQKTTN